MEGREQRDEDEGTEKKRGTLPVWQYRLTTHQTPKAVDSSCCCLFAFPGAHSPRWVRKELRCHTVMKWQSSKVCVFFFFSCLLRETLCACMCVVASHTWRNRSAVAPWDCVDGSQHTELPRACSRR
jgi:hypothetical protein